MKTAPAQTRSSPTRGGRTGWRAQGARPRPGKAPAGLAVRPVAVTEPLRAAETQPDRRFPVDVHEALVLNVCLNVVPGTGRLLCSGGQRHSLSSARLLFQEQPHACDECDSRDSGRQRERLQSSTCRGPFCKPPLYSEVRVPRGGARGSNTDLIKVLLCCLPCLGINKCLHAYFSVNLHFLYKMFHKL